VAGRIVTCVGYVPVIDLADPDVVDAVAKAGKEVGFLTIVNHGVSEAILDAAWQAARLFFDLPAPAKAAAAMPSIGYPYGYCAVGGERLSYSLGNDSPPDLKESLAIGPVDPPTHSFVDPDEAFAWSPNVWPASVPELRPAWEAQYRAMSGLAARLMRLFALALDLPATYFDTMIDRHTSAMRAINYPALSSPPVPGQLRAGAHTDYGTLTILRQDDAPGGLEVVNSAGDWQPVPYESGALVVNLGDSMAQWTNNRWRSTLHRVVLPPGDTGRDTRRQSFAFFHNANWDALIECLPSCREPGQEPLFAPVLAGPHLMSKFRSTVGHQT
jgi:isopenicillin N synthase-like dioxygenase